MAVKVKKLSEEQVIKIMDLYMARTKLHQIAEITGETPWRVRKVIYNPNNRMRRPENPNARRRNKKEKTTQVSNPTPLSNVQIRILVLTNFGYDPKEIAEDLKIHPKEVRKEIRYLYSANKIHKIV